MLTKKEQSLLAHRQATANLTVKQALTGFEHNAIALENAAAERLAISAILAEDATSLYQASLDRQQESTAIGEEGERNAAVAKRIRELFL